MRIELFYKDEKTLVIYTPGPPTNTTLDNERYMATSSRSATLAQKPLRKYTVTGAGLFATTP